MNLSHKAITASSWSFVDNTANQGIGFLVAVILARILSPHDFGLLGLVTIFVAISQTFVCSGLHSALIRKQDCSSIDYSTIFYFNLVVGLFLYCVLFISADLIGVYLEEPELGLLIRVGGLSLIISSFSIVHSTILIKDINFKLQAKISLVSSVLSGFIAIVAACFGLGVWSLIIRVIVNNLFQVVLLWLWNPWRPILGFSTTAFSQMFSFGSSLMISSVIETLYQETYKIVIGKYFSVFELGYYTRATQFKSISTSVLTSVVSRVSYPLFSKIQSNHIELRRAYVVMIRLVMLISFFSMFTIAASAKELVLILIGKKWFASVHFLELLCLQGLLYPLHAINLNILKVKGFSSLYLRLEIIKKVFIIPVIWVGVKYGITSMIWGMIVLSVFSCFINGFWSGKLIKYPVYNQLVDIFPQFILGLTSGGVAYWFGYISPFSNLLTLLVKLFLASGVFFGLGILTKNEAFLHMTRILKEIVISNLCIYFRKR